MKPFYGGLKFGILGGGQLGRMLIQQAISYNLTTCVLDPDVDAPCKTICDLFTVGSLTDYQTVYDFGKWVDLLTIEIEKVNVDALADLEKQGVTVYPPSRVIRLIQDKGLQKQFFTENDISTAPYRLISKAEDLIGVPFPYIQKIRQGGYDGRGVRNIQTTADLTNAFTAPSILEELIDFEKELSVIVARNEHGDIQTFPCVEMEFNPQANLVEFLISPADVSPEILQKADALAVKIARDLQMVGVLAVELFLTKSGELLVNELAPRPHNSGHQTIEGNLTSQYDQHLRAILNLPLGDTQNIGHSVMLNLLGEPGYTGVADYEGINQALAISGVYIHLYGKKLTKPYRKMGHVTIVGQNRLEVISKAKEVQRILKVKSR